MVQQTDKMDEKNIKKMNPTTFARLYSIFNAKRWHDKEMHEVVFSNFCELLGNLNEKQQNLILELAERYTWLTFAEYQGKLVHIFNNIIPNEEIINLEKIILFPVMKPSDEEKTKSGHGVLIILRGVRPFFTKYSHLVFHEIETFDKLELPFHLNDNERIFLLDDFLGTGETIKSTIEQILLNPNITLDKIRVITVASHIQAVNYMDSIGVKYYTEIVTRKEISDHYTSPELEEKTTIMKEIERLLPSKKYSFGYGQSEGLITLYRTPNNTFPIFWHDYEKNEVKYKAPFPRY